MEPLPSSGIVLHIWPGQWGLPSFDPLCLAAVLYLQLAIPGKFSVKQCSIPDSSPTGQLPFLVHEQHVAGSFVSIVKYVSGLRSADYAAYGDANLDFHFVASEKSQKSAWYAHIESHLGDLVYHNLYSNHENWVKMTSPALASFLPVPQKYYVPRRIQDLYVPRLKAAGLWKVHVEEKPAETPFPRDVKPLEKEKLAKNATLSRAFDRERVLERAQADLDIYKDLLDSRLFVFQNQVSSLDILLAAHVLLLLEPPFPDTLLKDLITTSYPSLESHARRIYSAAFEGGGPNLATSPSSFSFWSLYPSWPKRHPAKKPATKEDIHYTQMRWGFVGLALGSIAAYLAVVGSRYQIVWHVGEGSKEADDGEEDIEFSN
ncbi:hypothetical protein GALMADRAFT_251207 [Galerina marginata CBS 339.88]|uniref:Mitochondrial outer membrane transport complex Sam37/metaxin N-terminal domain-containing protein n=1 Tax=Galerina marginata (strain CBS 339.88) TaxID=685588 RepID=A0A067T3C7_GALM3|nr:hypothetical protein GALMADRAFT_251207 [Galerina marginata CBS 339.88]